MVMYMAPYGQIIKEKIMKLLLLALLFLIPQPSLAMKNCVKLNRMQAHCVASAAYLAGLAGGAFGLYIAGEQYDVEGIAYQNISTWQKIKSFKWHYTIPSSLAFALVIGSLVYGACVVDNAVDSYYNS